MAAKIYQKAHNLFFSKTEYFSNIAKYIVFIIGRQKSYYFFFL